LIAGIGCLLQSAGANAEVFNVVVDGPNVIFLAGRTDIVIPPKNQPWGDGNPNTFDGMLRHGNTTPEESLPSPSAGLESLPPIIPVLGGQVVRVLDPAIGGINYFNGFGPPSFGPEGNPGNSDLSGFAGISGYLAPRQGALVGVFLSDAIPNTGPPPDRINFHATGIEFTSLAPGLGQVFFIGDGKTSSNVFQEFLAPLGATRLAFGIPDGFAFVGVPGAYDDNDGFYQIQVGVDEVPPGVPIPAALPLFATGLGLLGLVMRRRRRQA
jgi:hypothetical protein